MRPGRPYKNGGKPYLPSLVFVAAVTLYYGISGLVSVGQEEVNRMEGAPPVIPHVIRDELECQHCHMINRSPGAAHLLRSNCLQCHVSTAANDKHLMMDIDWQEFAGDWKAESVHGRPGKVPVSETFEGGPPAIPHATTWTENCLDCHASNLEDGLATSHPNRRNCKQCHVSIAVLESRQFLELDPNSFEAGWISPVMAVKQGRRNPAKLPTMIPHEVEGFGDCLMCHSPEDTSGMATTHPERQNCLQCHVTAATTEDRKFMTQSLSELE